MDLIWLVKQVLQFFIVSMYSYGINVQHRTQANKSKLALHMPLIHCESHLWHLYIHKLQDEVIQVGVVCMGIVHVLKHLQEVLVWTTDK